MFSCIANDWTSEVLQMFLCIGRLKVLNRFLLQPLNSNIYCVFADSTSHDIALYPQQPDATRNIGNDTQTRNLREEPAHLVGAFLGNVFDN